MTTTAAAWRHVEQDGSMCVARMADMESCGCTTPTPDATSPCARCGRDGETHDREVYIAPLGHDHQPTRCTCGHALEAVR